MTPSEFHRHATPQRQGRCEADGSCRRHLRATALLATVVAVLLTVAPAPAQAALSDWLEALSSYLSGGNSERGAQIARTRCAACHGADGNSPDPRYPKLAGQNQAYFEAELQAFKTGARQSEVMSPMAAALSDADAADVASYFYRLPRTIDPISDEAAAALGERIFVSGSAFVPPCAACHGTAGQRGGPLAGMMGRGMMGHGMMGSSMSAKVPEIDGQHAAYVIDQLNGFAEHQRPATVMGPIATALSANERKAVAEYLSGHR
jgi:cytochrome c553